MATERQIAANKANAALSSGPKTALGKSQSCLNATKHGLASESAHVEAELSADFRDRRAKWAAEQQPVGEGGHWALDRVVAATFRIERCELAIDHHITSVQQRARLTWDQDRAIEAATVFARLAKEPLLVSSQLQGNASGTRLMIEAWYKLIEALGTGEGWSESEASRALDLMGVALDQRSGRTPIDDPEEGDPIAFRRDLALDEVDRLEALLAEALVPLDEMERRQAMAGGVALLSKPAKLLLRYERDAWRQYRESSEEVKASNPTREPVVTPPAPAVVPPPSAEKPPAAPAGPSFEEQRRALLALAEPFKRAAIAPLIEEGIEGEDAWLDALEARIEAATRLQPSVTERTQFASPAGGDS